MFDGFRSNKLRLKSTSQSTLQAFLKNGTFNSFVLRLRKTFKVESYFNFHGRRIKKRGLGISEPQIIFSPLYTSPYLFSYLFGKKRFQLFGVINSPLAGV